MHREIAETPSLEKVLQHLRQGRTEPDAPRIPDPKTASNTPDQMSVVLSDAENERQLSVTPRSTMGPSRSAATAGLPIGTLLYLVFAAFVACATVGVFFGIGFFLLGQPMGEIIAVAVTHDHATQIDPPRSEVLPQPFNDVPPADQVAPPQESATAQSSPPASLEEVSTGTTKGANPSEELMVAAPAVTSALSHPRSDTKPGAARPAASRARSAHHGRKLAAEERAALRENLRILSAPMDRAHREHFSDNSQYLTPPQAGQTNPFDQPLQNK